MQSESGGVLLVGVPGPELEPQWAAMARGVGPGGFILFGRNIKSPQQLRKLIEDLRNLCPREPIITIDQEGGRVSRLRLIGQEPPSAWQLTQRGSLELIRWHGDLTARLLRLFGFNLDLCPVLDLCLDENADNSLRGRCYGSTPGEVIRNAGEFQRALRAGGILSCGKHFPGYTFAGLDPHEELPKIHRSRGELEALELAPYRALLGEMDAIMAAHIAVESLEPSGLPASLSPRVLRHLLKEEMGFEGLVMTDDLDMGAILRHYSFEDMLRLALEAGNDLLMICHRVERIQEAADFLKKQPAKLLDSALERIEQLRAKFAPPAPFDEAEFARLDNEVWQLRVATLGEELARTRSPEDGKRSPVELY